MMCLGEAVLGLILFGVLCISWVRIFECLSRFGKFLFIAALFMIAKTWNQNKCPQTDECIEKVMLFLSIL